MNMKQQAHHALVALGSGAVGALVNSAFIFLVIFMGLETVFSGAVVVTASFDWLYPRLVGGAVLGLVFLIPVMKHHWVIRGLLASIIPTLPWLYMLFPLAPEQMNIVSVEVTLLTMVWVYLLSCAWGLVASFLYDQFTAVKLTR